MSKIYVDEIHPKTSGGQVTLPNRSAYRVGLVSSFDVTESSTWTKVLWDDSRDAEKCFLQDFALSNGTLTCPADGIYQVNATIRFDSVGSGYIASYISVNDTLATSQTYGIDGSPNASYQTLAMSDIFKLSAGDTLSTWVFASGDSSFHIEKYSKFSGFLVG